MLGPNAVVTIFGRSDVRPPDPDYRTAYQLGHALAMSGWKICNGGFGGTMEASARGAREAGGHTIGVTLRRQRRRTANRFICQEVPTFDILTRLNTLLRLGTAYIVLPGGTGTLLELAGAWEFMNKGTLQPRPLILLGDHWAATRAAVLSIQPEAHHLHVATTVADAVKILQTPADVLK